MLTSSLSPDISGGGYGCLASATDERMPSGQVNRLVSLRVAAHYGGGSVGWPRDGPRAGTTSSELRGPFPKDVGPLEFGAASGIETEARPISGGVGRSDRSVTDPTRCDRRLRVRCSYRSGYGTLPASQASTASMAAPRWKVTVS